MSNSNINKNLRIELGDCEGEGAPLGGPSHATSEGSGRGLVEADAELSALAETGLSLTTPTEGASEEGMISGGDIPPSEDTTKPKRRCRSGAAKKRARKARTTLALSGTSSMPDQATHPTGQPAVELVVGSNSGQNTTSDRQIGRCDGMTGGKGLKRTRPSDSSTPEQRPEKRKKGPRIFPEPSNFRDAVIGGRKMAITPSDYPEATLNEERGDLVVRALGAALDAIPEGMAVPRFDESRCDQGILWITCADDAAKVWLRDAVPNLRPWEGASLQILERECLPRLRKMTTVISGPPEKTEVLLLRLRRQNPGLRTQLWRVWDRRDGGKAVHLVLGIDEESYRRLGERSFVAHVGLGRALFRETQNRASGGTGAPATEAHGSGSSKPAVSKTAEQGGEKGNGALKLDTVEGPAPSSSKATHSPGKDGAPSVGKSAAAAAEVPARGAQTTRGGGGNRGRPKKADAMGRSGREDVQKGVQKTLAGALRPECSQRVASGSGGSMKAPMVQTPTNDTAAGRAAVTGPAISLGTSPADPHAAK